MSNANSTRFIPSSAITIATLLIAGMPLLGQDTKSAATGAVEQPISEAALRAQLHAQLIEIELLKNRVQKLEGVVASLETGGRGENAEAPVEPRPVPAYVTTAYRVAYQAGAESKLLPASVLAIAVSFQTDHKRHRDVLRGMIKKYGGTPEAAKNSYDFVTIKTAGDILNLALRLEQGAVDAYLANAYKLQSGDILNSAVPIVLDEVRHATVYKLALGLAVTERPKY